VLSTPRGRAALFLITITFIAFISLGLPDGLLDIANPRIRDTFEIGPDLFSLVFVTGLTGYFLSSFFAGHLVNLLGIGLLLSLSCATTAFALLGYALSPHWAWFVLLGLFGGGGAGAIDTGLNVYVAHNHGPRLMFWLHASFGVGVTLGTWLMSLVVNSGTIWRVGYAIVGVMQVILAVTFLITRKRFNQPHAHSEEPAKAQSRTPIRQTLRLPVAWIGIALFFLYVGVEASAGRWSTSLFIQARGVASVDAGAWVSAYWATFTLGRVAAGFVTKRLRPEDFSRIAIGGMVLASLLLVWNPFPGVGALALSLMGFTCAPVFPVLISLTPKRVGEAHSANTIGFQIASSAIGGSVIPGLIGVLARSSSFEVMPLVLLAVTVLMFALHEIMLRVTAPPQPASESSD